MKKLLLVTFVLTSLNAFAEDIVCNVKLLDLNENVLSQRELRQNTSGMSAGTIAGSDFHIEATKRRLLKKPLALSVISFSNIMNGWDNSTKLQFYRKSEPNSYDILTKTDLLGEEITTFPGEHNQVTIDNKYIADIECSLQESRFQF